MAVLAIGTAAGWISRDVILVTILVFGSARAFQTPTTAALLPAVVPTALLSRAVAASSSANQIAIIAGPAIGGVLYWVSVVIRDTLIQVGTPDLMRGRVSAVHSLFIGTSNQLGQFRAGLTADWFGAVAAVVIGGAATLLVVVAGLKVFPELAGIKSVEGISKSSPPPD